MVFAAVVEKLSLFMIKVPEFERVRFTLISMPCCRQQLCWVNPRPPNYCPECGKSVIFELRFRLPEHTLFYDDEAVLELHK
jgi:hypothetical protein